MPSCGCKETEYPARFGGNGYTSWLDDCERRRKRGEQQVICLVCLKWRWPDEVGPNAKTMTGRAWKAKCKAEPDAEPEPE